MRHRWTTLDGSVMLYLVSFAGGVLTIASPCILPVLPFALSGAGRSFRHHALPLLAGMAITFTAVGSVATLAGDWVVRANQLGRGVALAVFGLLGLALVLPAIADRLSRPVVQAWSSDAVTPGPCYDGGRGVSARRLDRVSLGAVRRPDSRSGARRRRSAGTDRRQRAPSVLVRGWRRVCARRRAAGRQSPDAEPERRLQVRGVGAPSRRRRGTRWCRRDRDGLGHQPPGSSVALHLWHGDDVRTTVGRQGPASRREPQHGHGSGADDDAGGLVGRLGTESHAPARRRSPVVERRSTDTRRPARQGGADRLLDLLLHQLPSSDPVRAGLGAEVSRSGPGGDRRSYSGVRVRARRGQRRQGHPRSGADVPGRRRQQSNDLDGVRQPFLARPLRHRPSGQDPLPPLR